MVCCTIDLEASGFGASSYPIEVGFVRDDGLSGCTLIRPLPEWTHWDEAAARVHGIGRDALQRHGRPPARVAAMLNGALAGRTVYCDGWAHDYPWLARLFDAAGCTPAFRLESAVALIDGSVDDQLALQRLGDACRRARATLGGARHRASADARALQWALNEIGGG
jgi:hypothetical protein